MDNVKAKEVNDKKLHIMAYENMGEYGTSVVTDRALADFRDGFKPVQRRSTWAMKELGLKNSGSTAKSARVVGLVIGVYNPHGDLSAYGALTNMTGSDDGQDTFETNKINTPIPIATGQGQLGYKNSKPAAMRYTEVKLSKYAETCMLQPDYLKVTPMMPNYDGDDTEPTVLPSLLPNILLNGTNGIAVGVKGGIPPFKMKGVAKLVAAALKGKKITPKACLKALEVNFRFGGQLLNTDEEMLEYYKTGEGTVRIAPNYEIDGDTIITKDAAPYYSVERYKNSILVSLEAKKRKSGIEEVLSVEDLSDANDPFRIHVVLKGGLNLNTKKQIAKDVIKKMTDNITLRTNVVEQISKEEIRFHSWNIPTLINKWVEWRVDLEKRKNQYLYDKTLEEIKYQNLMLLACDNLETIFKVLKSKNKDMDTLLAGKLKITVEEAKTILELRVRRLSALSRDEVKNTISEKKAYAKEVMGYVKKPAAKVYSDLVSLVKNPKMFGLAV